MKTRTRWKPELPLEVADTLQKLRNEKSKELPNYITELRSVGWSLGAISIPLGLTRERVRQLNEKGTADSSTGYEVPELPTKPVKEKVERIVIEPNEEVVARLLELQPMAQQVRGKGQQFRAQGVEYSRLIANELQRGVLSSHLAKKLGVTHSALNFRMVRYGYSESHSTAQCYKRVEYSNLDNN